jgi:Na+-transporting NADH:ubiquinone oxidoreductase subunit NqrF
VLEKDGSVANEKGFTVPTGVSAFDAASWNGIAIDSTCGGYGTCKKCRIKVTTGDVEPSKLDYRAFTESEIKDGWRLACLVRAAKDVTLDVPPLTTRPKAATVGVGTPGYFAPCGTKTLR